MVKKRFLVLLVVLFVAVFAASAVDVSSAQDRVYYFGHEYAKVWINPDRTIDLFYDRSLTLESGRQISWVEIGMPKGDFFIDSAMDQYGNTLTAEDTSSGDTYKVRVTFNEPVQAGQTINFTLLTNVAGMLYEDTTNPGNVGMQFAPAWDIQTTISDVRILIVLPPNVTQDMVKTTDVLWDNAFVDEETGNLAIYWETSSLAPNEQYMVGVSFPSEYVQAAPVSDDPLGDFLNTYGILLVAPILIIFVVIFLFLTRNKLPYTAPKVSMETLGIRRGLTAVEASYLLELKPPQIVTEILYSLLQKRAVWVESTKPSIKLRIMPDYKNKTGTTENPLRYYEIDFLQAVKDDGTLDEEKLAQAVMFLRDALEEKLHGFSRNDTVEYYKRIVDKAWSQVQQAGTPDIASSAYDEQLLWLLLDPEYQKRTQTTFETQPFQPSPIWFWYWYGYTYYNPRPIYKPNIQTPTKSATPPAIPGADFANNIATSLEQTSSNIVVNLEKFANSILPAKPSASRAPARDGANCVCACAACACACACVSCACACAGGGVG